MVEHDSKRSHWIYEAFAPTEILLGTKKVTKTWSHLFDAFQEIAAPGWLIDILLIIAYHNPESIR